MDHSNHSNPDFSVQKKIKKPPRKKILIASIIIIGILALIGAFGKGNPSQQTASVQEETVSQTKEYQSPLFSFSYPSAWTEQSYAVPRGGIGVQVSPPLDEGKTPEENIQIEATPLSRDGTLQRRVTAVSWDGAEQTETDVSGNTGILLSGQVRKDVFTNPSQRRIALIEDAGYIYTVRYEYAGASPVQEKEAFFTEVLSSVNITDEAL